MKKFINRVLFCLMAAVFVWLGMLITDRQALRHELIRLHVVAASDSEEDQRLKLQVRDAVVESLRESMSTLTDAEQARLYLQENLPKIEALANRVLEQAGCADRVSVNLCVEEFAARVYDTFTLPAGLYEALRITIGEGEGENWWCVVFPDLCMAATVEQVRQTATYDHFSQPLTGALTGEDGYEFHFFLLEVLGHVENFFHRG